MRMKSLMLDLFYFPVLSAKELLRLIINTNKTKPMSMDMRERNWFRRNNKLNNDK
jgi:hypothetical protein